MRLFIAALALGSVIAPAGAALAQDAANGKAVFSGRCGACHQVADAKSGPMAPSLKGVVGRKVASLPDFAYSDALKAKGGKWSAEALDTYLASPVKAVPGGKMFMAVTNPADRADLIAFLKTAR